MSLLTAKPVDSPYAHYGARLVDMGYSAIPCRPGSKRPGEYSFKRWYGRNDWQQYCDRVPTDTETKLWSAWPDAGVCLALGRGLIAIDVDTDDGELRQALSAVLPQSAVMKRGRKGFTAFYRGSDAIRSAAFNVNNDRVLDLLAHGKQTVMPPTIHPETGQPYVWIGEPLDRYNVEDLPELSDDIADRIRRALEPFGYVPPYTPRPSGDGYGASIWREVNSRALANLDAWVPHLDIAKLERKGVGYKGVADWRPSSSGRPTHLRAPNLSIHPDGISDYGDSRTYTPLDLVMASLSMSLDQADTWLRQKIGYTEPDLYGLEPWFPPVKIVEVEDEPLEEREVTIAPPRGKVNPFTPEAAGGLIGKIAAWVLENARRPVPEYGVMVGVTFLAALYGRRCVGPTGAGLNVYMVGIGTSAYGKGHPLKCIKRLANDSGMLKLVLSGDFTADSAIERAIRTTPSLVLPLDEFGLMLQGVNGKNAASWTKTIRKALLELYSLSTDLWHGKNYADQKRESGGPIYCPTLSILGMSTPDTFYSGLVSANLSDGFLNRITLIHPRKCAESQKVSALLRVPQSLIEEVKRAGESSPSGGNLGGSSWLDHTRDPSLFEVPWEDGAAEDRWEEMQQWQFAEIEDGHSSEGIVGRTAEQVIKYATIRALSRAGFAAAVAVDDVEWGWAVVQHSLENLSAGIQEFMAESDFEALYKAILAALKRAKGGALSWTRLLEAKGIGKHDDKMINAAVDRLVARMLVVRTKGKGGGRGIKLVESAADTSGNAPEMD